MITEKQIEEAARICGSHFVGDNEDNAAQYGYKNGYKDGYNKAIQEFLKGLWHPAKEVPRNDYSDILVIREVPKRPATISPQLMLEDIDDDETSYKDEWDRVCKELQITKYLYIGDLLTKQEGGNEQ